MKYIITLILLVGQLTAAEHFWQELIITESRFYTEVDRNATVEINASNGAEHRTSGLVDAQYDAFSRLLTLLKNDPYAVKQEATDFYNVKTIEERLFKLKTKIGINERHGYEVAVDRDRIARDGMLLEQEIYHFFTTLADRWTKLDEAELLVMIEAEQASLGKIAMEHYESYLDSDRSESLTRNLQALRTHYYFYEDFLNYLKLNPNLLHYRMLMQALQFDAILRGINDNVYARGINLWLRYVGTDLGRLCIALLVLLFSWFGSYILYSRLSTRLKAMILKEKHVLDDLLLSNVENVRKPLFLLIITYGLELSLKILIYPDPLKDDVAVFYFIYLATITYILATLVNNFFFEYLFKHTETANKKLRNELLNLIVSVIKVVIVLTAVLLFLSRIGVNITGLVASLGIGGLAVALAAQNTLSNFFGLLKIIYDNSFSQGDWIKTSDVEGTVVEIGFISTMVRTFDNAMITVPNATLANVPLKNWSRRSVGRRIKMHIGVTYGSKRGDVSKAIEEIREMLHSHPGIVSHEKLDARALRMRRERKLVRVEDKYGVKSNLLVYLDRLSDSSIDILIYAFTRTVDWEEWLQIKQEVILKIWEILEANDLEFAFPSQSVYLDAENVEGSLRGLLPEGR